LEIFITHAQKYPPFHFRPKSDITSVFSDPDQAKGADNVAIQQDTIRYDWGV